MTPRSPAKLDFLAAFLSYLLPGLGQVFQGRLGKGILFFVTLYGLFFYGLTMGQGKNVWIPEARSAPEVRLKLLGQLSGLPKGLYHRPQFLVQFWIGMAAWPAVVQFATTPDAEPGEPRPTNRYLGRYMQAPTESELNVINRDSAKLRVELGWVYTVIAGVLNILVIYDALAGPAVRTLPKHQTTPTPVSPTTGSGS